MQYSYAFYPPWSYKVSAVTNLFSYKNIVRTSNFVRRIFSLYNKKNIMKRGGGYVDSYDFRTFFRDPDPGG